MDGKKNTKINIDSDDFDILHWSKAEFSGKNVGFDDFLRKMGVHFFVIVGLLTIYKINPILVKKVFFFFFKRADYKVTLPNNL